MNSLAQPQNNAHLDRVLLISVGFGSAVVAGGRGDWNQFVATGRSMFAHTGWSVFARNHDVQTGPISLAAARILAVTARNGFVACALLCMMLGVFVLRTLVNSSADLNDERQRTMLTIVGGSLLLFSWAKLGGYGHLDDAMVLAAGVTSTAMMRANRKWPAAILLGLSIAVKPWAIVLLPITLCRRGSWRQRLGGPALSAAIGGVIWAPFIVFAPDTLKSMRPTVNLASDSVLRIFGATSDDIPASLRTAQLLAALAVATIVAWRGHTGGVLLAAIAVRLGMDPGTWAYYTPGLVVGALVWDAYESRRKLPWVTIAASLLLLPSWIVPSDEARACLRLLACVAAVAVVLGGGTDRVRARSTASIDGEVASSIAIAASTLL